MAKKCLMEKAAHLKAAKVKDAKRVAEGKKQLTKANVRAYNRCQICGRRHAFRCQICGRRHAFMRKFGVCRLCFRELAVNGMIPGVTKASW